MTQDQQAPPDRTHSEQTQPDQEAVPDFDLLTRLDTGITSPGTHALAGVFLARQQSLQRLVVVKISPPGDSNSAPLAQLDHDHIARVYDQRHLSDGTRLFYVQYLPGGSLAGVLDQTRAAHATTRGTSQTSTPPTGTSLSGRSLSGQSLLESIDTALTEKGEVPPTDSPRRRAIAELSWPETIAWLGQALSSGLAFAHRHGCAHGRISGPNVLFTADAQPKLADFSASTTDAGGHPNTAARDDLAALGRLLWELLTGQAPPDDPAQIEVDPAIPRHLERVLVNIMSGKRDDAALVARQFALCLDPQVQELLDPPERSWRYRFRTWFVPLVALAAATPNALASWYNIKWNDALVFANLTATAEAHHRVLATVANVGGFSLGTIAIVYLCRRLILLPRRLRDGKPVSDEVRALARIDAIRLSEYVMVVSLGLWLVSTVVQRISERSVTAAALVHFATAQVVSACAAAIYPFFLLTRYAIGSLYPAFLSGALDETELGRIRRLRNRSNVYIVIAAAIPLMIVATATLLQPDELISVIVPARYLCLIAVPAFVLSYWMFRRTDEDLRALLRHYG